MFNKSFQGLNVAELIVRCLESHGVTHIFGIPGAKIDPVFEALAVGGRSSWSAVMNRTPHSLPVASAE